MGFAKILLSYIFGYVRIAVEGYYIERFINISINNKILIWIMSNETNKHHYLEVFFTQRTEESCFLVCFC